MLGKRPKPPVHFHRESRSTGLAVVAQRTLYARSAASVSSRPEPYAIERNAQRWWVLTGPSAIAPDMRVFRKPAFDELPNPLGRNLACARGAGRPTRTREEPDQAIRRGRGRPPHCGTNCQPPFQNTSPTRAITVRGCRKCVPLNVDRKLYRATLLVMLAMSRDAVNFSRFSV